MSTAMTKKTMVPMTVMMTRTKKMKDFLWRWFTSICIKNFFVQFFFSNFFQTDEDDQDDGSDYEYDNQILDELGPI